MPGINGADVLVYLDTGDSVENWVVVGGQRDVSFNEDIALVDISHKLSGSYGEFLPGRITGTLTLDAVWIPNDAALVALKNATRNRTTVKLQRYYQAAIEEADFVITSKAETFPDQAEGSVSLTFQQSGAWVASS